MSSEILRNVAMHCLKGVPIGLCVFVIYLALIFRQPANTSFDLRSFLHWRGFVIVIGLGMMAPVYVIRWIYDGLH